MMNNLVAELARLMDVPESDLHPEAQLTDFGNWDSLTMVSLVVAINALYGVTLTSDDINVPKTVGDLLALIDSKKLAGVNA